MTLFERELAPADVCTPPSEKKSVEALTNQFDSPTHESDANADSDDWRQDDTVFGSLPSPVRRPRCYRLNLI